MGNMKKSLKYGTNSLILIVLVVTIAILLNIVVAMFDYKFDLTSAQIFSIGEVSKKIVQAIPEGQKVEVYGMFDNTKQKKNVNVNSLVELLNNYKAVSNGKLSIIYKDPVENPKLYADLGYVPETQDANNPAMFIIKSGVKSKVIYMNDIIAQFQVQNQDPQQQQQQNTTVENKNNSEQAFSGAIKYVSTAQTPKIYFTQGHNEKIPQTNFTKFLFSLENNNFDVSAVNLLTSGKVPSDCTVLFLLSPARDLDSNEKDAIYKYLAVGGSVVFGFDGAFNNRIKYDNIQKLLDNYGVEIKNDRLNETNADLKLTDPKDSFVAGITGVNINLGFEQQTVQIINSRSFEVSANKVESINNSALISTSPYAQSTDIFSGKTQIGVQNILVGSTRIADSKTSKVIALGSVDFISDKISSNFLEKNNAYFISLMNWLSNTVDDNIVAPKPIDNLTFKIAQGPGVTILIITVIVLPLLIFAIGLFIFLRRRHL